jgi:hypothetical protein
MVLKIDFFFFFFCFLKGVFVVIILLNVFLVQSTFEKIFYVAST